jgi:hypothetical protein
VRLVLGCILILTCCCKFNNSTSTSLDDEKVTFSSRINSYQKADDTDISYLLVTTVLRNNLKDTFSYGSWDCSWDWNYIIDSKDFNIKPNLCFKNGPCMVRIPPCDSIVRELTFNTKKTFKELSGRRFRIGVNLPKTELGALIILNNPSKMKNVIWSNTLTLK